MSVRFEFEGLDELRQALRALPSTLADKSADRVRQATKNAEEKTKARYEEHRVTGNLADKVSSSVVVNGVSVLGTVKSSAKHAWMFENGTQARHTEAGANRGAMPPAHAFIPVILQERREMYQSLKEIIAGEGLEVSGDA